MNWLPRSIPVEANTREAFYAYGLQRSLVWSLFNLPAYPPRWRWWSGRPRQDSLESNSRRERVISGRPAGVRVNRTDEERMIAETVCHVLDLG